MRWWGWIGIGLVCWQMPCGIFAIIAHAINEVQQMRTELQTVSWRAFRLSLRPVWLFIGVLLFWSACR